MLGECSRAFEMWSPGVDETLHSSSSSSTTATTTTTTTGLLSGGSFSSSSSYSSSSSFPSPFSPLPNPRPKTMEDVWKDISFSSLDDHSSKNDLNSGPTFQDFFAIPHPQGKAGSSRYGSLATPPATLLDLNSGPDVHLFRNVSSEHLGEKPPLLSQPFDSFGGCAAVNVKEKKRSLDPGGDSGDRRHKRMMKNRESAARSRARKQAYTNELELEVDNLMKENARLKEQQKQGQLCVAAADQRYSGKHALHRTSTAPF